MKRRRWTDRIREAADALWTAGLKEEATWLHYQAREAEKARKICTCGAKTMQVMFHKPDCTLRQKVMNDG